MSQVVTHPPNNASHSRRYLSKNQTVAIVGEFVYFVVPTKPFKIFGIMDRQTQRHRKTNVSKKKKNVL